jgi:hypothetical protein
MQTEDFKFVKFVYTKIFAGDNNHKFKKIRPYIKG